mmetsp:Transcript_39205/g.44915  ORF Transcript_39205/g.44915 Transcript_39205/m.44915 type:complete len:208 (-) Transcript_39205:163-786(-)
MHEEFHVQRAVLIIREYLLTIGALWLGFHFSFGIVVCFLNVVDIRVVKVVLNQVADSWQANDPAFVLKHVLIAFVVAFIIRLAVVRVVVIFVLGFVPDHLPLHVDELTDDLSCFSFVDLSLASARGRRDHCVQRVERVRFGLIQRVYGRDSSCALPLKAEFHVFFSSGHLLDEGLQVFKELLGFLLVVLDVFVSAYYLIKFKVSRLW